MSMFLYRVSVRFFRCVNGVILEPGMSVEVQCPNFWNPMMSASGRQAIEDAFYRRYGLSLEKAKALDFAWLKLEKI